MNPDSTKILETAERDEKNTSERLLPLVYDELRRLAAAKMSRERENQTLQPTALVHEAWLRLNAPGEAAWDNRRHFFAAAAEAMRRILIERARRRSRLRRGGGQQRVDLHEADLADATPDERILLIDEALERLRAEDPQAARLVTLKFFGGLTNREVAENLQVTERTVERRWAFVKAWLFDVIREEL